MSAPEQTTGATHRHPAVKRSPIRQEWWRCGVGWGGVGWGVAGRRRGRLRRRGRGEGDPTSRECLTSVTWRCLADLVRAASKDKVGLGVLLRELTHEHNGGHRARLVRLAVAHLDAEARAERRVDGEVAHDQPVDHRRLEAGLVGPDAAWRDPDLVGELRVHDLSRHVEVRVRDWVERAAVDRDALARRLMQQPLGAREPGLPVVVALGESERAAGGGAAGGDSCEPRSSQHIFGGACVWEGPTPERQ